MKRNTYVIVAAVIAAAGLIILPMALAIRDMLVEPKDENARPAATESVSRNERSGPFVTSPGSSLPGDARSVSIPAGTYRVGIDPEAVDAFAASLGHEPAKLIACFTGTPEQRVRVDAFEIDRFEVTCADWREFLDTHPDLAPPHYQGKDGPVQLWPNDVIPEGYENHPVSGISQEEAIRYAAWRGRRLPTEFEWEIAARYGQPAEAVGHWPWGDTPLNHKAPTTQTAPMLFAPVDAQPDRATPTGIHHLAGNAAEWTSSSFKPYPGFRDVVRDRRHFRESYFTATRRVVRGGHAIGRPPVQTTWVRNAASPHQRFPWVGFRTARSLARGRDLFARLEEQGELPRRLVDYRDQLLPGEQIAGSSTPSLRTRDPDFFTAVRTRRPVGMDGVRYLGVVSRDTDDVRDEAALRRHAAAGPLLIGMLWLDFSCVTPKLQPDLYAICWRGDPSDAPNRLPDGVILESLVGRRPIKGSVSCAERMERMERMERDGTTRIELEPDTGRVRIHLALRGRGGERLVVSFALTLATATVKTLE